MRKGREEQKKAQTSKNFELVLNVFDKWAFEQTQQMEVDGTTAACVLVFVTHFLESIKGLHHQSEPEFGLGCKVVSDHMRVELDGQCKFGVVGHHVDVERRVDVKIRDVGGEQATE